MDLLLEISDNNFSKDKIEYSQIDFKIRKAVRTILLNSSGECALLSVTKENYFKLPGGGIELGEDIESALRREVKEEVGADIDIVKEVGIIVEYRIKDKRLQISYCYLSYLSGEIGETSYDTKEKKLGSKAIWLPFKEAVSLLNNTKTDLYVPKFILKRDSTFINEAFAILNKS